MRLLFALVVLLLLGTFAPLSLQRPEPVPSVTFVTFEPVPLDEDRPERRRLGSLVFLGGWNLDSNDPRFGGISALHVDGHEVSALSDAGWLIRFTLPADGRIVRADLGQLPEGPGSATAKTDRDIESMAMAGPWAWIGYERANAVWRYRRSDWTSEASAAPQAMRRWRANRGSEAMLRLRDGRFLVFSEGSGGDSEALLFGGDPAEKGTASVRLKFRPPAGYRVTDAALLPDGRMLFLNRRFRLMEGFTARLSLASPVELKPGAVIEGREIAAFAAPVIADNFEGLSVTQEGGRTILWIASDDNYNQLQRTLLLKFALVD